MSMNVSLPPELEARVRQRVETGMYGSASEVIREALRLFEAFEEARSAKLESLRLDIARGLEEVKAGHLSELDVSRFKTRSRELLTKRNVG